MSTGSSQLILHVQYVRTSRDTRIERRSKTDVSKITTDVRVGVKKQP